MADRAALVTGGSSGVGLGLASMLAARGHAVTIVARRPDKLEAAARLVQAAAGPGEVQVVAGDLADEDVVMRAMQVHRERFGRLDVLVNCAGVGAGEPIERLSTKRLDLQLAVNVRAAALLCREGVDLLRQAGAEHRTALILNVASITGKQGAAGFAAYSAAKFAVVGLTQALDAELGAHGVKVTALCPALIDTPMTDFIKGKVPAESMIRIEDVVAAVGMLLDLSPACVVPELVMGRPGGGLSFA